MVGIDSDGFDVFIDDRKIRFTFDQPITTGKEARIALVAMSQEAKNGGPAD